MNIKELIYDTLEKETKQYIPQSHYPSSASFRFSNGDLVGPDLLQEYLKWTGVPPSNPSTAPDILRMKLGDGVHGVLTKIFNKCSVKTLSETSGKSQVDGLKYPISYRTDQLLEIDGKLVVLEVKSSTEQQMYGKGWGIESKGPKMDHLLQTFCYLELVPMVHSGVVLYIARDSGRMLEYQVRKLSTGYLLNNKPVKEVTWEGIVNRWKLLETHLNNKTLPEPEHRAWINEKTGEVMDVKTIGGKKYKTDWRVLYSPYMDYVWKNPDNFKYSHNAKYETKV